MKIQWTTIINQVYWQRFVRPWLLPGCLVLLNCNSSCLHSVRPENSYCLLEPRTYVTEWVSRGHFCLALCSVGPSSRAHLVITWRGEGCRYMMRLGQTVKRPQLLKIKAQLSSIWAKGCILITVCVLSDWHDYPSLVEGESHGIYINTTAPDRTFLQLLYSAWAARALRLQYVRNKARTDLRQSFRKHAWACLVLT